MTDLFSLTSSALPKDTRVLAFRGSEGISTVYGFDVQLVVTDAGFDMAIALGAEATLSIGGEADSHSVFHGILASIESAGELAGGAALYVATLAPRVSRLSLTKHSRAFVDETLPAIIQTVFRNEGLNVDDYSFQLSGEYPRHSCVCQYQESSLAFLSRRMEREGIYFYFEQGDDREKVIITDDCAFQRRISETAVPYAVVSGHGAGEVQGLHTFNGKHHSLPGLVELRGYDYLRPGLPVTADAVIPGGSGTVRLHDENFTTSEEGSRLARIRAEELQARRLVFRGAGSALTLRPGYAFKLEDHPRFDGEYLTTELSHVGVDFAPQARVKDVLAIGGENGYRLELVAIPAGVQYRPERRSSMPRIYGTERATIDGETSSAYAQIDEHGRYLVRIHFDENPAEDGKASPRIRMMQPHGGGAEAFHFPLRKGTEVLLSFEGGDPDRPVIAGVVPNLVTPSPVTAKNATKNIIQTGGGNKLVIEDEAGKEYVHIRTSHKGTYLHLGAPFNPSYTKTSYTEGTSLSFTRDISTSVTGTDAQTLVEDSRITIIGRSKIQPMDPRGQEIATLVGSEFIDRAGGDPIFDVIAVDVKQTITDAVALLAAVPKGVSAEQALTAAQQALTTAQQATPPDPNTIATLTATVATAKSALKTAAAAIAAACKTATADFGALDADAAQLIAANPQSTNMSKADWKSAADDAFTQINAVNGIVNPKSPATWTPSDTGQSGVATLFPDPFFQALGKPLGLASDLATALPSLPPAATTSFPLLPNQSATPNYIAIKHPKDQMTTLTAPGAQQSIDDWITSITTSTDTATGKNIIPIKFRTHDETAIDVATNGKGPKLHEGSDVKIVGGDNVTMAAHDARSHYQGHSFSLVQGGQTSVLYSPFANTNPTGLVRPIGFVPPSVPHVDTTVAQSATTYGDTFSWVNGTTNSHVTGDTHSVIDGSTNSQVDGSTTSQVNGDTHSDVAGTAHAEIHGGQTSFVHKYQQSFVLGSRSAEVIGNDLAAILGGKETVVLGLNASATLGIQAKMAIGLRLDLNLGPHIENKATIAVQNNLVQIKEAAVLISSASARIDVMGAWIVSPGLVLIV